MPHLPHVPHKKAITLLVISIVLSSAIGYVKLKVPYAKNLEITGVNWDGDTVHVTGSVDIEFKNHKAWTEFGYKDGNFQYFHDYWVTQATEKALFSYNGVTVRLLEMDWTLAQHYKNYDHLLFTIKAQLVSWQS